MNTRALPWPEDADEVLSTIDELRKLGVGNDLELPQIIVCGDQSAGKSAVLNAISLLNFPSRDGPCTRFATEVVMRTSQIESLTASIVPGPKRSNDEKLTLEGFKYKLKDEGDIYDLIGKAETAMKINPHDRNCKHFSEDILRFEIARPQQPRLTLVDLPGLFHAATQEQRAEDIKSVKRLVQAYMKNKRSIILAVISATYEIALQKVTTLSGEADKHGVRTLGIVTKPDKLDVDSDNERKFVDLIKNKEHHLHLGWHVLVNRDQTQAHYSPEERDDNESKFLSKGIWADVEPQLKGISALKLNLVNILRQHILEALPDLIEEAEREVARCASTIRRLGPPRSSLHEQRQYLLQTAQSFNTIMRSSINGSYDDKYFDTGSEDARYQKRLRAVIQNTLTEFAETVEVEGSKYIIVAEDRATESAASAGSVSRNITRHDFETEVMKLMKRGRGRELPGTYDPMIVRELFMTQSEPWRELARRYSMKIFEKASASISLILEYITHKDDKDTKVCLEQCLITPLLNHLQKSVRKMVRRLLKHHHESHPITYNRSFLQGVQTSKCSYARDILRLRYEQLSLPAHANIQLLLESIINEPFTIPANDLTRIAASEAIDVAQRYYTVAKTNFIDNFSTLAIEDCLVSRLPNLLTPGQISKLKDEEINRMATETDSVRLKRTQYERKLQTFRSATEQLRKLKSKYPHNGERFIAADINDGYGHDMSDSWAANGSTHSTPSIDGQLDSSESGSDSDQETPNPTLREK